MHEDSFVKIYIETKPKEHICPSCGCSTKRIHDYRLQTIKDLPFQLKHCYLVLRKRRYVCSCGKRFFEHYSFLPKYFQRTTRLTAWIASELHSTLSLKMVANRANISVATVTRILDSVSYTRKKFPEAISIDEFKRNADSEKYQCILVDPIQHQVLDILPSRKQAYLVNYFSSIPKAERYRVKFFCCDMWQPYVDLARIYFPNAMIVIDTYHFLRQVTWAMENVRKRIQKGMPTNVVENCYCNLIKI